MMSSLSLSPFVSVRRLFALARAGSRPLTQFAFACVGLLGATLLLQSIDPRTVTGVNAWVKPAKFAASVALTSFTLALLLRHVRLPARGGRRAVAAIVGLTALELVIITLQAARGVPSHFNFATRLDAVLFQMMAVGIVGVMVAVGYIGVVAFRQRLAEPALGWGIRLGIVSMLVGGATGFAMPRPTPAQLASLRAGAPAPLLGAHTVGAPDGGPGLRGTGWSTVAGDLRVAHFIGLHGLQVLPFGGWLLARRRRQRRDVASVRDLALDGRLAIIAGAGYLGLTVTAFVGALRARPLLAPDGVTAALAFGVVLSCAAAVAPLTFKTRSRVRASEARAL